MIQYSRFLRVYSDTNGFSLTALLFCCIVRRSRSSSAYDPIFTVLRVYSDTSGFLHLKSLVHQAAVPLVCSIDSVNFVNYVLLSFFSIEHLCFEALSLFGFS